MQENWIGKSRGLQFSFERSDGVRADHRVHHPPRHADGRVLCRHLARSPDRQGAGSGESRSGGLPVAECRKGGTTEEAIETAEKLGYDTGIKVKHPLDPNWELPVWIANFILMDYGTGAIFRLPCA